MGLFYLFQQTLHGCKLNFLLKLRDIFAEKTVGIHQIFYRLAGMNYRRMIPSPKMFTIVLMNFL